MSLTTCPKCKREVPPHTVCRFCGHYAGRAVIKIAAPAALRAKATAKKEGPKKTAKPSTAK